MRALLLVALLAGCSPPPAGGLLSQPEGSLGVLEPVVAPSEPLPPYAIEARSELAAIATLGATFEHDGRRMFRLQLTEILGGELLAGEVGPDGELPWFGCVPPEGESSPASIYREGSELIVLLRRHGILFVPLSIEPVEPARLAELRRFLGVIAAVREQADRYELVQAMGRETVDEMSRWAIVHGVVRGPARDEHVGLRLLLREELDNLAEMLHASPSRAQRLAAREPFVFLARTLSRLEDAPSTLALLEASRGLGGGECIEAREQLEPLLVELLHTATREEKMTVVRGLRGTGPGTLAELDPTPVYEAHAERLGELTRRLTLTPEQQAALAAAHQDVRLRDIAQAYTQGALAGVDLSALAALEPYTRYLDYRQGLVALVRCRFSKSRELLMKRLVDRGFGLSMVAEVEAMAMRPRLDPELDRAMKPVRVRLFDNPPRELNRVRRVAMERLRALGAP